MKLQIVVNSTFEEEKALINIDTKQVLAHGDYYHDKIDEYIGGFLSGLSFANVQYELLDDICANPDTELFTICEFDNNNYDDREEDIEYNADNCFDECNHTESMVEKEEMKNLNFIIRGENTIHTYCNIIEAIKKTREREADLYYKIDNGDEDIIYSCFGWELDYNNELLLKFGVAIDEKTNEIKLLNIL